MNFAINYIFALLWLAYLITSGVLLFSRGFLLSRVSKTDISSCRRLSVNPYDEYFLTEDIVGEIFKDVNATSNLCLPQKTKVIILVIDALKYEFGLFKENLSQPLSYENKLTVFHELLLKAPERTRLLRFRADPPTTTMQRLKGLTTGSLPTFIDIGSNFASSEINEDNIIDQMNRNGMPVVFLGDSTWTDLYPRRFIRSYSYPSFDIFDLDTVDKKIQEHLPRELGKTDWQVLIAHFLGVDHCGHKHGPLHQEMGRKLGEMDKVIRDVIDRMDNDTTLLVMGDHGMTITGDHGGESEDEVNALLFAYSKWHRFISSNDMSDVQELQQIDLVPTLATILGIPIPFSNLGLIHFNIVPDVKVPYMTAFQTMLLHAWQNAQQMHTYFNTYAFDHQRTFNVEQFDHLENEFVLLTHRVKTVYNAAAFKSFVTDLKQQLRQILSTCREIWVKFDATQMSQGLLMTFFPVFFTFLLVNNLTALDFEQLFTSDLIIYTYLANFLVGFFGYRFYNHFDFKSAEHGALFLSNMLSTSILTFLTVKNWINIATNWSQITRFGQMPTRIICLIAITVFFSNSFIIQEAKILAYLVVASVLLLSFTLLQQCIYQDYKTKFRLLHFLKSATFRTLVAILLAIVGIRCTFVLFRCREEQKGCADFSNEISYMKRNSQDSKATQNTELYLLSVVAIVLYTTLTRLYLRACGNLTGHSINVLIARYGPTVGSICASGHLLVSNSEVKNIQRSHIDIMALVIYALLLLQIVVVTVAPLMIYVAKPQSIITCEGGVIPEIYKKIKSFADSEKDHRRFSIPVVYGLATVYSSIIISFGLFLAIMLIVLMGPKAPLGFVFCIFLGVLILIVNALIKIRTAVNFETCVHPTFTTIASWFLLAHFSFFATSHQTTLSQIDWRAAFVGRSSGIGSSNFLSGVLVILNTFGGQIFFMCMYGLLSTETFSVFALFPNLIKTNCNRDLRKCEINDRRAGNSLRTASDISQESLGFDMTRGELTLFENEEIFLGTAFKLAAQFFMIQGLKVFCSMMACTIHCRHLMVWKIFAPRFIYESLATFVSLPAIIIGYLLLIRIHYSINKLISKINKLK